MEAFLHLPKELQTHVLCFLTQHELTNLFGLTSLFEKSPPQISSSNTQAENAFEVLKHQALLAMFHRQPLLLSNDFASKSMPLCHLRKLIDMGVHIVPSEVNINVFDFTDYEGSFSLWDCFTGSLFSFLSRSSAKINIELVLWENVPLDPNILRAWLEPLILHGVKLSDCRIRYSSSLGFAPSRQADTLNNYKIVNDIGAIPAENLSMNFFGPTELFRHLSSETSSIALHNVTKLDLSFNQLSDFDLRSLKLPKTLQELNLSNNAMSVFDSECLPLAELINLTSLDLSNNNIMRLDICQAREQGCSSIKRLNLSGNFLSTYSQIFAGNIFANIEELDLSHNLISQISAFAESLRIVNLSGNYISTPPDSGTLSFPEHLEFVGIDRFLTADLKGENEQIQHGCKL
ncbi:hypothetical protein OY671_006710 [Metschnikowia pulcherrima]|nr:hypothetical protein OY671_006710 [Metschnikowia pulcherrima]